MKKVFFLFFSITLLTGCFVVEQNLGASDSREEGFSGYGTARVRNLEGPLSDMMVPDGTPKGRIDRVREIAEENKYFTDERVLGFENQGTNRSGARIYSNRPGTLHDNYILRDKPYISSNKEERHVGHTATNNEIRDRIENIEFIERAYVYSQDNLVLIGVESSERNRPKIVRAIEEEMEGMVPLEQVKIALDRRNVSKIRALEEGALGIGIPFNQQIDNVERTYQ